ncbi:hypothetical protein B0H17DRAFT_1151749 [Mycena rosella]|uniref:Uncharacterized protein n=1 Tax=Mycena rosella TaxID=1033263 RepID=A0AAD7FFY2_MYCRO|nr:hypothetical protein B0H17DRAFT_1151749 [Mycena rosella]
MDKHYNHPAAEWSRAERRPSESFGYLDRIHEDYGHIQGIYAPGSIYRRDQPSFFGVKKTDDKTTKVVYSQDGTRAEAIFTMVGALKAYDIPPVKKNSLTSARIPDARAYPELVRYDSKHFFFAAAMDKVKDLTYTLSTSFSMDKVEHWIPVPDSNVLGPSINSSCRYFTVGVDIPKKHAIKNPGGFRVGDIVEMGFALIASRQPNRGEEDKQICKLVLRTLTLLDNPTAKAAFKARSAKDANLVPKGTSIMRLNTPIARKRFDFQDNSSDDEDYPEIRKCMALLRVEDSLQGDKFPEETRSTWSFSVISTNELCLAYSRSRPRSQGSADLVVLFGIH